MSERNFIERAPRIPLDVQVNCDGNKFLYSKNLSETGIALLSDIDFPLNKIIQMKFFLPGEGGEVSAFGKVVRTAEASEHFFEIGISFWDIEDDDRKILEDFFKKQDFKESRR